jgi:hypothetical protein
VEERGGEGRGGEGRKGKGEKWTFIIRKRVMKEKEKWEMTRR